MLKNPLKKAEPLSACGPCKFWIHGVCFWELPNDKKIIVPEKMCRKIDIFISIIIHSDAV